MTGSKKGSSIINAVNSLSFLKGYKQEQPQTFEEGFEPGLAILRAWQADRLSNTYADLLASQRYGPACRFFLSDVYAPQDFSNRNQDIEYLYKVMSSVLPDFLLSLVREAIDLNDLSSALDLALLDALENKLKVDHITAENYGEAYRICNNYDERVKQIELLVGIGRQTNRVVHFPLVGTTIKLARSPANSAGWGEVHGFLERGYKAFKSINGAKVFLNTIRERELQILDNIFSKRPNPFSL